MVLSQGRAQYVNGHTRGRAGKMALADGPFSQADKRQLRMSVWSKLRLLLARQEPSLGSSYSRSNASANMSLRISLQAETNFRYPADRAWAKHLDKSERGIESSLRRQQLHLLQWSHLRTCMFLVDAEEQGKAGISDGKRFGLVLKLREDSVALQPWLIPSGWARQGLTSLRCMKWGGVMDSTFAVGRRWAWTIMEGLAADWYISHYAVENRSMYKTMDGIPYNPESWLARLARLKQVPVRTKTLCELPFVSARFVSDTRVVKHKQSIDGEGLSIVVKRHHYFAARYDGKCYGTRIKNGTDVARTWHDRTSCAGAEAVRAALEIMGVCPSQLCATR